jgi:type II secretory pathway component GspD/PulD (secretin)
MDGALRAVCAADAGFALELLMIRTTSVRSLLAAAGLIAAFNHSAAQAQGVAQGDTTAANNNASAQAASTTATLDRAADLLANFKPVHAKSLLSGLTRGSTASLTDDQLKRAMALLANANNKIKSLSPSEVSLQTAQAAIETMDLVTVERHANAVINSPKATNEQTAQAKELLTKAAELKASVGNTAVTALGDAVASFDAGRYDDAKALLAMVQRTGVDLTPEQAQQFSEYQTRIVELEQQRGQSFSAPVALGMLASEEAEMQPGVVKRREPGEQPAQPETQPGTEPAQPEEKPVDVAPAQPAEAPVPAPAPAPVEEPMQPVPAMAETPAAQPEAVQPAAQPAAEAPVAQPEAVPAMAPVAAQPATDPIAMAQNFEAQSIFAEAETSFADGRINDADAKYRLLSDKYMSALSSEQQTQVNARLAEIRTRLTGAAGSGNLLDETIANNRIAREQAIAEFNNDMELANSNLAQGNVTRARDLASNAKLRVNTSKNYFSVTELDEFDGKVKALQNKIDQDEAALKTAQAAKREVELKAAAAKAAGEADLAKRRKIDEAIDRVRDLQKEQQYEEALQVVDQILFLDPQNPTGLVLRDVLTDTVIYRKYDQYNREKTISYGKQELANSRAIIAPENILDYPSDWPRVIDRRGEPTAFADSESNRKSLAILESKKVPVAFNETPLSSVVSFIGAVTNLNIDVDWPSLENVGIDKEAPITLNLTQVPVKTVLDRVVEKVSPDAGGTAGAAWSINDGVLTIASREVINKNKALVIYDIRDLLIEVPDYTQAPEFDLQQVLQNRGGRGGGGGQSPFQNANEGNDQQDRRSLEDRTNDLIRIITTNVDANGWQENGGDVGYIQQLQGSLIITNTPANHRAIQGLLSKLREIRALQINVETRFLLVSQDYFEQIGFDLDVYFNARNNQVRTARATDRNVRASDFFDFQRGGLQRVLNSSQYAGGGSITPTTTGTGTQALQNVTLPSPLSPIGAGGNSLGLAEGLISSSFAGEVFDQAPALGVAGQFLDDIQVDFLIKATQADRRNVSLTAPRLTFTNGQTSNIYVATQTSYVSDLQPIVSESAVGFDPTPATLNEGVRLLVEGTVSADRRYVTVNVDASIAKLRQFNQSTVTAVAGGQLVNSGSVQSFIQLPVNTVTRVQTTVTIPDQGTILLGGQRLVTEAETETGVPFLSKIPIINRFFTNRVETKEEQTLLILLKPTIIIQNEEENRAFPGLNDSQRMPFGG